MNNLLRDGAAWSARQIHNLKVAGSNPAPATNFADDTSATTASTDLVGTSTVRPTRWAGQFYFMRLIKRILGLARNRRGRRLHRYLAINGSVVQVA